jgi:hypothetical protein
MNKGIIIFRGDYGNPESHYSKSQVAGVTDTAALDALATALGAYTDCNVAKKSFVTLSLGTDSEPSADANVDKKGIAYFRDTADLSVHSVTIPAIKDTLIDDDPQGQRINGATMTAIVSAIATATGKTLVPLYGVVVQKR